MREREFWELLEEVFGRSYGRSLARDQRMPQLANMTVLEALDAGEEPRVIWNVLCDQFRLTFITQECLDNPIHPLLTNGDRWSQDQGWLAEASDKFDSQGCFSRARSCYQM